MKLFFKNKKQILSKILSTVNNEPFIISGGSTIKNIFNNLNIKLNNIILLSDERLVKINSNLRNDLFYKKLISKGLIKEKKFIHYKWPTLNKTQLSSFNKKINEIKFNYAILGLGSNGHIASIFNASKKKTNYHLIENSPKFPKRRLTISLKKLKMCKRIYLIASFKNKKKEIRSYYKNNLVKEIGFKKIKLLIH